jgi:iron complex outermembrane receptor protein
MTPQRFRFPGVSRYRAGAPFHWACVGLLSGLARGLSAQDSAAVRIAPVSVTVTRDAARSVFDLPYAVARLTVDSSRAGTRRATMTEMFLLVPGVTVVSRYNPTQDPRISVRGFGARSAFGIRGVRVLRDGIPLTLADGQTAVDFVDLESVGAAEVFRGSAGALYGNASGGVVDFRTAPPPDSGLTTGFRSFHAGGITRLSANAGGRVGPASALATVSHNTGEGPRDYSRFRSTHALGDARWSVAGTALQAQLSFYDSPKAENPGAVTAAELDTNRFVADPQNITRKAGKTVRQVLAALQASRDGERGFLSASAHAGTRDLANPQPFAIVEFDRVTYGGSVRGQYHTSAGPRPLRVSVGADVLSQIDDRLNYANCAGVARPTASCPTADDRGVVTLDQRERVTSIGAYLRAELAATERLSLTGALRNDRTRFTVQDRRPAGAGATIAPSRTLGAVTPMVGVTWRLGALSSVYANVSSSFETPTTTELANQPDGSGGLNRELRPQHGTTYEAGFKGIWAGTGTRALSYDVAVFLIDTQDELIPFEVPGGSGRRFFRNAGRTSRRGAEVGISGASGPLSLGAAAAWLDYEYDDFVVLGTSFTGKRVPGVAPRTLSGYATARHAWGLVGLEAQHVARTPADDANTVHADPYTLLHLRASLTLRGRAAAEPYAGIDNLFDETYASNIVVNAARGRFFEPGPGRTVYVGFRLRVGR